MVDEVAFHLFLSHTRAPSLAKRTFSTPEPLYRQQEGFRQQSWQQEGLRHQSRFTCNRRAFDTRAPLLATGGFSTPEFSLATGRLSTPEHFSLPPCVKHIQKEQATIIYLTPGREYLPPCVKHIQKEQATIIYLTPGREYPMETGRISPAQKAQSK